MPPGEKECVGSPIVSDCVWESIEWSYPLCVCVRVKERSVKAEWAGASHCAATVEGWIFLRSAGQRSFSPYVDFKAEITACGKLHLNMYEYNAIIARIDTATDQAGSLI